MKKVLFYLFTLLISTNIVFAEHLDNEMNVMSFNIRMSTKSDGANWWEYRKDLAANVIKFYDVDMFVNILLSFTERIVSLLSKVAISGWRKI